MIIAVAGKGGVGKSTLAALVIRYFVENKYPPVLAVDADPNSTLGDKLGLKVESAIGDIRENALHQKYDVPAGVPRQRMIEYQLEEIIAEGRGFDLVEMGRGEGPGCYCSINNMLRSFLHELSSRYMHIVIDNEAGLEHLSRLTNEKVDLMLVVSDPTPTSLQAARRISQLCRELDIIRGRIGLVVNRDNGSLDIQRAEIQTGLELFGCIPEDLLVKESELLGCPLMGLPRNSGAVEAIAGMLQKIGIVSLTNR